MAPFRRAAPLRPRRRLARRSIAINGRIDNPREALHDRASGVGPEDRLRAAGPSPRRPMGPRRRASFRRAISPPMSVRSPPSCGCWAASRAPRRSATLSCSPAKRKANGEALTLSKAKLTATGQRLEGALTFDRQNGRYAISGTLAADKLDLAPLTGAAPRLLTLSGGWSDQPFAFRAATRLRSRSAPFGGAACMARPRRRRRRGFADVQARALLRRAARSQRLSGRVEG